MSEEKKYRFLPEVGNGDLSIFEESGNHEKGKYPCPCCGYLTLPVPREEAIAYICPVCFWENDVFTSNENEKSDENHGLSLNEGRKNFRAFGACDMRFRNKVREPYKEEIPIE